MNWALRHLGFTRWCIASAVIVVGAQALGCAGEYCQSGPHGGTQCGYVSGPADPAGWRPQSAAPLASTSTSTSAKPAAPWPFPPPVIAGTAGDAGVDAAAH